MLIVGAGGMATQIFTDLVYMNLQHVAFWSEQETKYGYIEQKFPVYRTDEQVRNHFAEHSKSFILCVGSGPGRRALEEKFTALGGNLTTYISPIASVSEYDTHIGQGTIVMSHVIIEPAVHIGKACIFNKTSNVGHGCIIGDYTELAPGVILTGEVEIGENCLVGTRVVVLPKVRIGANSVIAAGAVVRKDVPENSLVAGEPAKIIRSGKTSL
jgi:sugar O-acyltransferase (sialic acid O-acetyltransferase NeuD family)